MLTDPRDPAWYWDEFDAALRPRVGALAVVAAALMAVCTLPDLARHTTPTPPPMDAAGGAWAADTPATAPAVEHGADCHPPAHPTLTV